MELLAPTARAAKNITQKTGNPAHTIHSLIYRPETDTQNAIVRFLPKINTESCFQVYIIDESSMISDKMGLSSGDFETNGSLLHDLLSFIRQGNPDNKIIFVGDECQLAPVGYAATEKSPALDQHYICQKYELTCNTVELDRVMRQAPGSYILDSAYEVRNYITRNHLQAFPLPLGKRFYKPNEAVEIYLNLYHPKQFDDVIIISMSNKYLQKCNLLIRYELGFLQNLQPGDRIVLTQNFFGRKNTFIANGEIGEIIATGSISRVEDMHFMDVEVAFRDVSGLPFTVCTKLMIDVLLNPGSYTRERRQALHAHAYRNNPEFRKSENMVDDDFLSAMQAGYGHAFTCHKAQGSEWNTVLFNTWMPLVSPDNRFLYTGITRARKDLYTNGAHTIKE